MLFYRENCKPSVSDSSIHAMFTMSLYLARWGTFNVYRKSDCLTGYSLLTMPKPLTVDHNKLWKILKEMGILDHLTCLLRNLYAGQEATVRTGHGTTD